MKIKEVCLYSPDLESAKIFYGDILGFQFFSEVKGRHIFFRAGELMLLVFNPEATKVDQTLPPHYVSGVQHIAFEVPLEDYEARKQKLINEGISIIHEQVWEGGHKSFYFHDPSGNLLEIVEPGIWGF